MPETIYGYLIGHEVRVDIETGVIARTYASRKSNLYAAEAIFLSETSMQLFIYLLEHARQDVATYSSILHSVWDRRGLVSSYKRLNHLVRELREKLAILGLPDGAIRTVRGRGYQVLLRDVTRLYSRPVVSVRRGWEVAGQRRLAM